MVLIPMNNKNGNDGKTHRCTDLCRLVNISMLASFIRDFPLTYLSKEERERILDFQTYVVHLESQEFEKAGVE